MASPAREIHGLPRGPRFVRTDFTISPEKWAAIMGQEPAFSRSGDTLYILKCEGLRSAKGLCWALALEAFGVICGIGLWRFLH